MVDFNNDQSAIINQVFSNYERQNAQLSGIKQKNIDSITKMLGSNVPTPRTMMDIAQQSMAPITGYEISRGDRRPTTGEVMRAAEASDLKYSMGVADLINKGEDNAAHEMQIVINAINAQTAAGNTQLAPIKGVMSSIMPTLSPQEAVMFSRAFMGRIGNVPPDELTDQRAWLEASSVLTDLDPKGKVQPMKVVNSNGEIVVVDPSSKDASLVYQGTPKPGSKSIYTPIYTEEPIYDDTGAMVGVSKIPVGGYNKQTNQVESVGGTAPSTMKVTPPPAGFSRQKEGGLKATPGGPHDPVEKITSKQSAEMAQVKQANENIDNTQKYLFEGGELSRTRLAALANRVPMSDGRMHNDQMMDSIASYVVARSGLAVTDAEREMYKKIFIPNSLDNEEGVKSKLTRLKAFFNGSTEHLPEQLKTKFGVSETKPAHPMIAKAKDAIAKGANKEQVIERLKAAGIDTSGL